MLRDRNKGPSTTDLLYFLPGPALILLPRSLMTLARMHLDDCELATAVLIETDIPRLRTHFKLRQDFPRSTVMDDYLRTGSLQLARPK